MKLVDYLRGRDVELISPYIREGSGLKHVRHERGPFFRRISPYIREGSGLKQAVVAMATARINQSPLTSVRGAD